MSYHYQQNILENEKLLNNDRIVEINEIKLIVHDNFDLRRRNVVCY